jgi:hypothetical protein
MHIRSVIVGFNFPQALDKSQLGEIIREKGQKLDTPGR